MSLNPSPFMNLGSPNLQEENPESSEPEDASDCDESSDADESELQSSAGDCDVLTQLSHESLVAALPCQLSFAEGRLRRFQ